MLKYNRKNKTGGESVTTKVNIDYSSERAFAESVYRHYGGKIYLLAYRILKSKEESEDCVQEVMRRIVANPEAFMSVPEYCLKALIVKCTTNAAISLYRKVKRRRSHELPLPTSGEITFADKSGEGDPDSVLIRNENASRFDALIGRLGKDQRDVIIMKYKMGMKNSDIAKVLGVSESVINMRLYHAKKQLLKKEEDELYDIRK